MKESNAVLVGTLWVTIPVIFLLVVPAAFVLQFIPNPSVVLGVSVFVVGFIIAWLWWSVNVPKWRLWAYKRVSDINLLKVKAIEAGITWPDNSIFARTEIKSKEHIEQEKYYENNA